MKKPKTKHTQNKSHLSDVERIIIQNELDHNTSPYQIAQKLSKSPSTIVREIRNHSIIKKAKGNDCLERKDCTLHSVCKRKHCTQYLCKKCKAKCTRWCEDYIKEYGSITNFVG